MADSKQLGPPLGNVAAPDAYLRIIQNISNITSELANVKQLATTPNALTEQQLSQVQQALQAGGLKPLNLTALPGVLLQGQPILEDTHAARLSKYPPTKYPPGTGFLETDTELLYEVQKVSNARQWVAIGAGPILRSTHSARGSGIYSASVLPLGEVMFESDRTVAYQVTSGPVWSYAWGIMQAAFSALPNDLTSNDAGFLFYATDWDIIYRWSGTAWIYFAGIYAAATASRPSTLGSNDANFLFIDTTLKILEHWTGSAWVTIGSAPTTQVLAYRDVSGSSTTITAADFQVVSTNSGAAAFAMPDLTTVPGQIFAIKNSSGSTNTLTLNAFSGQTIDGNSALSFAPGESAIIGSDGTTNGNILAIYRLSISGISLQGLSNGTPQTLTTAYADVNGCSVTLSRSGLWLIQGIIDWEATAINQVMVGQLVVNGTAHGAIMPYLGNTAVLSAQCVQNWLYTAASGDVAKLQAKDTGAAGGTINSGAGFSSITATWIHS